MAVKGTISIKDNMTSVLRQIKKEQGSFKKDVNATKKVLQRTWDKKYQAKLDATPATKKIQALENKMKPIRKKVVTAVAVKDMATAKVKSIGSKMSKVGKMVVKPTVKVATYGTKALSGVGKAVAKAGKVAALGVGAVAAAGAAGIKAIFNGSEEAAKAQVEAETKLGAVLQNVKSIQKRGNGAYKEAKKELMGVASGLQQVGVIGDEVTLAGMQQLATFQLSDKQIKTLSGGMTDLLAQQKGVNATQRDAVGIGNLIGKVMNGQVGALTKVGVTFSKAQEKALKTGDANKRAAVLAEVLKDNVGGVNKALAKTDQGKIQQVSNAYGDMKEEVGKLILQVKTKFASALVKNIPAIQKLGKRMVTSFSSFAEIAVPVISKGVTKVIPILTKAVGRIGKIVKTIAPIASKAFKGFAGLSTTFEPVFSMMLSGFQQVQPYLISFTQTVMQSVNKLAVAFMPVIQTVITTVTNLMPTLIPVLTTITTTITQVLSAAAPVISGLVTAIGTTVSTLAPVFSTIFSQIGEKVGSVLSFIGSKMGFINQVISTVMPVVGEVISGAWGIISPILDLMITSFKAVWSAVEFVFPAIQNCLTTVWSVIKPIVEGIGGALDKISSGASWVLDKITGGSGSDEGNEVGSNASGTNNWKGGPTWVGENGPELLEVPRGAKILPNKESVALAASKNNATEQVNNTSVVNSTMSTIVSNTVDTTSIISVISQVRDKVVEIRNMLIGRNVADDEHRKSVQEVPKATKATSSESQNQQFSRKISISIAKLADQIIVREEADIDEIADRVASKVIKVVENMA